MKSDITLDLLTCMASQVKARELETGVLWATCKYCCNVGRDEIDTFFTRSYPLFHCFNLWVVGLSCRYGWDVSQNWPSLFSAYSRHMVGFVDVIDVEHSQTIQVTSSCDSDVVYRIKHRMASDDSGEEYFLIENRGACGYDLQLKAESVDRQGIVIWHVDHTMLLGQNIDGMDVIRYDSQKSPYDPAWPGVHSRVSLLCADGQFDLELNKNRGNEFDAFRKSTRQTNMSPILYRTRASHSIVVTPLLFPTPILLRWATRLTQESQSKSLTT